MPWPLMPAWGLPPEPPEESEFAKAPALIHWVPGPVTEKTNVMLSPQSSAALKSGAAEFTMARELPLGLFKPTLKPPKQLSLQGFGVLPEVTSASNVEVHVLAEAPDAEVDERSVIAVTAGRGARGVETHGSDLRRRVGRDNG